MPSFVLPIHFPFASADSRVLIASASFYRAVLKTDPRSDDHQLNTHSSDHSSASITAALEAIRGELDSVHAAVGDISGNNGFESGFNSLARAQHFLPDLVTPENSSNNTQECSDIEEFIRVGVSGVSAVDSSSLPVTADLLPPPSLEATDSVFTPTPVGDIWLHHYNNPQPLSKTDEPAPALGVSIDNFLPPLEEGLSVLDGQSGEETEDCSLPLLQAQAYCLETAFGEFALESIEANPSPSPPPPPPPFPAGPSVQVLPDVDLVLSLDDQQEDLPGLNDALLIAPLAGRSILDSPSKSDTADQSLPYSDDSVHGQSFSCLHNRDEPFEEPASYRDEAELGFSPDPTVDSSHATESCLRSEFQSTWLQTEASQPGQTQPDLTHSASRGDSGNLGGSLFADANTYAVGGNFGPSLAGCCSLIATSIGGGGTTTTGDEFSTLADLVSTRDTSSSGPEDEVHDLIAEIDSPAHQEAGQSSAADELSVEANVRQQSVDEICALDQSDPFVGTAKDVSEVMMIAQPGLSPVSLQSVAGYSENRDSFASSQLDAEVMLAQVASATASYEQYDQMQQHHADFYPNNFSDHHQPQNGDMGPPSYLFDGDQAVAVSARHSDYMYPRQAGIRAPAEHRSSYGGSSGHHDDVPLDGDENEADEPDLGGEDEEEEEDREGVMSMEPGDRVSEPYPLTAMTTVDELTKWDLPKRAPGVSTSSHYDTVGEVVNGTMEQQCKWLGFSKQNSSHS
ncbi:unnamed protein product [Protopolystoma xenopodis]|uniref:Uncharacterized protein n=1 Tax=Protopolystoma xenopodis TaxID=117903 RepID=A0A3S5CR94_9PLAT|nr:unnamed protein product [Protopolystoma xenopodis]